MVVRSSSKDFLFKGLAFSSLHSCKIRSRLIVDSENLKSKKLVKSNSYNHETVCMLFASLLVNEKPRRRSK
jgi:hypothetical protein